VIDAHHAASGHRSRESHRAGGGRENRFAGPGSQVDTSVTGAVVKPLIT
jgi:hypothetical protein